MPKTEAPKLNVLLVDDDADMLSMLSKLLSRRGYAVETASSATTALAKLKKSSFEVVISDVRMPKMDGVALLEKVKERTPRTAVVLLTGYGTIETAVNAMKKGAYDYITKPPNPDEILLMLEKLREAQRLMDVNEALARELTGSVDDDGIVGEHPTMQELNKLIERVARADSTVLIRGESGTGKELVARSIHLHSPRARFPFIVVNCAAMSSELLENELFGHERGAYTDARERRLGKFEVAHRGTIFLDEIGAMSTGLQQSLLRVLQEKSFERVGGTMTVEVDVRVVAATNADMEELVKLRQFRDDLYYRLNVVRIDAPPLRHRLSDVPALATHFLGKYVRKCGRPVEGIDAAAVALLQQYQWPGNVRELENAIERALVLGESRRLMPDELPAEVRGISSLTMPSGAAGQGLTDSVDRYERELLLRALVEEDWNQSRAAETLQINRTTLIGKMKKHQITSQPGQ
ncbi:MAG: sigma-54-dependent Fis family transcriptional regulator, partial [Armatimonadetes bacterium]|nr:sigma-54-dependent Fis family transcriptional regulator [Armatimonadota bacterium]